MTKKKNAALCMVEREEGVDTETRPEEEEEEESPIAGMESRRGRRKKGW